VQDETCANSKARIFGSPEPGHSAPPTPTEFASRWGRNRGRIAAIRRLLTLISLV
jgi:hypothetical protein